MRNLFVVDPVCAQFLGHNYSALLQFTEYFRRSGIYASIVSVAATSLPIQKDDGVLRHFEYCYERFMPVLGVHDPIESARMLALKDAELIAGQARDWARLFEQHDIGAEDTILLPSVDYYSFMGLQSYLMASVGPGTCPQIRARFIGVLENAASEDSDPRTSCFAALEEMARRYPISASTETPRYSSFIAARTSRAVSVTPYPVQEEQLPLPESGPIGLAAPGSQRLDKGIRELPEIIHRLSVSNVMPSFRFEFQLPPPHVKLTLSPLQQLYANPWSQAHPYSISIERMRDIWSRCEIALLPYEAAVYALRGSAVLMEALNYERLIVTLAGTAFSEQVSYLNCGLVAHSIEEFCNHVVSLSLMSREERAARAMQAKYLFKEMSEESYTRWMR